jgi:hypothetical protein
MKWIINLNMLIISLVHSKGYVQRRDVHFIYELASNTTRMIFDKDLNKEKLTAQESKYVIDVL